MPESEFLTSEEVSAVYQRRAKRYDISANLYYLIGFREQHYRRMAVDALQVRPGDTVVDLGCGTGLNFSLLQRSVGPTGSIIGVDLTAGMLDVARERVRRRGWRNVELVQSDAASFKVPRGVGGVLSTYALTLDPNYADAIRRAAEALRSGGRLVLLDLRLPENWLRHLAPLAVFLVRPFAVSLGVAKRRPWDVVARFFARASYRQLYLGFAYLAVGEKSVEGISSTLHTKETTS